MILEVVIWKLTVFISMHRKKTPLFRLSILRQMNGQDKITRWGGWVSSWPKPERGTNDKTLETLSSLDRFQMEYNAQNIIHSIRDKKGKEENKMKTDSKTIWQDSVWSNLCSHFLEYNESKKPNQKSYESYTVKARRIIVTQRDH